MKGLIRGSEGDPDLPLFHWVKAMCAHMCVYTCMCVVPVCVQRVEHIGMVALRKREP